MPQRRALHIAEWSVAGGLLALTLVSWLSRLGAEGGAAIYFNADVVYPAMLVEDVLGRGHPFWQWHLTPAPSLFPDLVFAAASHVVLGTRDWAQYSSAALQVVALIVLVLGVSRLINRSAGPLAIAFIAAMLLAGLRSHEPLSQLWLPAYHTGAVLSALGATWLVLAGKSRLGLGALCLISGLSDGLFVVGWAVPAVVLAVTLDRARRPAWFVGALTSFAGLLLSRFVLPFRAGALPGFSSFDWARFAADWATFDGVVRLGLPMMGVALLLISVARRELRAVCLMAMLATLMTVASVLITGNFVDSGWSRYLLWPLISCGLTLVALGAQWPVVRVALGLGLTAYVVMNAELAPRVPPASTERITAECLDALEAGSAIGDYWHAKPLTLLAKKVTVVSFDEALQTPYLGIISRQWFRDPKSIGLIIADGLDRVAIERAVGPATEETLCGPAHVLIYRGEARDRLQHYFAERVNDVIGL